MVVLLYTAIPIGHDGTTVGLVILHDSSEYLLVPYTLAALCKIRSHRSNSRGIGSGL